MKLHAPRFVNVDAGVFEKHRHHTLAAVVRGRKKGREVRIHRPLVDVEVGPGKQHADNVVVALVSSHVERRGLVTCSGSVDVEVRVLEQQLCRKEEWTDGEGRKRKEGKRRK